MATLVDVMMAVVMGVSPGDDETLERAGDLGLAFQLANIARDVAEDDRAARCYVPAEWLAENGIPPGEQMKPPYRAGLVSAVTRLCQLAHAHECSARLGAARLRFRQRWAILSAAGIYGEIARAVQKRGAQAWDNRTVVSDRRKLMWIVRAALRALRPVPRSSQRAAQTRRFTRRELAGQA